MDNRQMKPAREEMTVSPRGMTRRYERPRILSREPLEAVAAICTPTGKSVPGLCPMGPISS
jgi:hypothetical protein